jgi:hypothetical protein
VIIFLTLNGVAFGMWTGSHGFQGDSIQDEDKPMAITDIWRIVWGIGIVLGSVALGAGGIACSVQDDTHCGAYLRQVAIDHQLLLEARRHRAKYPNVTVKWDGGEAIQLAGMVEQALEVAGVDGAVIRQFRNDTQGETSENILKMCRDLVRVVDA